jgi:hypothetical protein
MGDPSTSLTPSATYTGFPIFNSLPGTEGGFTFDNDIQKSLKIEPLSVSPVLKSLVNITLANNFGGDMVKE